MSAKYWVVLWLVIGLVSCKKELVDKVVYSGSSQQHDLVVEGGLNSFNTQQFISISKPSYTSNGSVVPINDALVSINDIPLLITSTPGVYSGAVADNKRYGESYHLKIVYRGKTFEATDTLKKVLPIVLSDLNIKSTWEDQKVQLSLAKHSFNRTGASRIFYRMPGGKNWDPSLFGEVQNYSYLHVYPPPYSLSPILEQRTAYPVNLADIVDIYKFSLSEGYEKYLYTVFQETDWKSLFSANPAAINGNISGGALGYFYCSDVVVGSSNVQELISF